jgi:hypothetical protein
MSTGSGISVGRESSRRWSIDAWVDLHLRPGEFFAGEGRRISVVIPVVLVGMATVIDRIDTRLMLSELRGRSSMDSFTWSYYWAAVVAGGCLAGPILYYVQGWWVRVRARFSSAPNANRHLCRRIASLTSCIWAIPTIASTLIQTCLVETPQKTTMEGPSMLVLVLGSIYWSIYASYQAVSRNLPIARTSGLIWFAILPSILYAFVVIGVLMASWGSLG